MISLVVQTKNTSYYIQVFIKITFNTYEVPERRWLDNCDLLISAYKELRSKAAVIFDI